MARKNCRNDWLYEVKAKLLARQEEKKRPKNTARWLSLHTRNTWTEHKKRL